MITQEEPTVDVEFYIEAVHDKNASEAAGRPIYRDVEMVKIVNLEDRKKEFHAPAHEKFQLPPGGFKSGGEMISYKQRYFRQYEVFKSGQTVAASGTPIEELPFLTNARRKELKLMGIHTAESLAALDPTQLGKGMFLRGDQEATKAYLAKAKDNALETRLSAENAELKGRLERLEEMLSRQGQAPAVSQPTGSGEVYASYTDDGLKALIKERTGSAPKGQPSRATLVRMAEEAGVMPAESVAA